MSLNRNCKYFRGDLPCKPHKKHGYHCENCPEFQVYEQRILVIKLGAAGDVIRSTVILHDLRQEFPHAEITWLTDYPILVPKGYVDNIISWNDKNTLWLQTNEFDLLVNLDKDRHALALAKLVSAKLKKGYLPDKFGKCTPADLDAEHKFTTGIWDDECISNRKGYPQEVVEILGYQYKNQQYILDLPQLKSDFTLPSDKQIIALNTGCGTRWLTRLWGKDNWIKLSNLLAANGYYPLLIGGPTEDQLNQSIAAVSQANYLGYFSLDKFLVLVNRCDLVVTSVTMAMHIAIGYNKRLVLLNNIFNKYEFELYGLGEILEPFDKECLCCYNNSCEIECMSTISVERVYNSIISQLGN